MDQRQTTTSDLYERAFPSRDLAYYLGELLQAPVSDIPTVEDLEREQGHLGLPTREQGAKESGQGLLDWLAQAGSLMGVFRGSAAGREQELMGKQRGLETFGKEMMDTSRRALPNKWNAMRREHWARLNEEDPTGITGGREAFRGGTAPSPTPGSAELSNAPADVVRQQGTPFRMGAMSRESEGFRIGEPVSLPDGKRVQYIVSPGTYSYDVKLYDGDQLYHVDAFTSMGEAIANARKMQNRLALAAKDYGEAHWNQPRTVRFPWERGVESGPQKGPTYRGPTWPWEYTDPPRTEGTR